MMIGSVSAQMRIVVDGQTIPEGSVDNIAIIPDLNEINITTTDAYVIDVNAVGDAVAITGFGATPESVVVGGSVTFNWTTSNANSCSATGGVDGWAGSSISLPNGSKSITTSVTGVHTFTLTCEDIDGNTATSDASLTVASANAVSITNFIASPDVVEVGDITTLSWTTPNADSCTASGGTGGWGGSISPNSSVTITTDQEGTYTFTLTCVDVDGGQASKSEVLTVNSRDPRGNCDTSDLSERIVDWSDLWGSDFPAPVYKTVDFTVSKYGYTAIKFNSGNIPDKGKILGIENTSTRGIVFGAISECPGDFNVENPSCDYLWGLGGAITWSTNAAPYTCQLDTDKTYYLNITFTDGVDPSDSTCVSTPCVVTLRHENF